MSYVRFAATIATSTITDPRARQLADENLAAQVREIGEMKALIADLEGRSSIKPGTVGRR
jgi:uncharacterized protein (DUF305 family)